MSTLFDTDNRSAGWHLKYLEIYNWGTFHDQIYRLSPEGRNSLLTGANGSGKTTVVDALITLMVPPGKRHYNQSSGADKKKERDEVSYFLGAYGTLRDEESTAGSTQYLRTKDDTSILLACFANESFQQEATLAQIRWFSAGTFKRLYLLSTSSLEIERDLTPYDSQPSWKKSLSAHHPVKFYDTFALYGQAFSALFGLRSEKALSLFSHVVGVKVLGDLNEFIRENMLDLADMEEDFAHLKKNYEDLLSAHKQIEKAREQLKLLEPVVEKGKAWSELEARKSRLDGAFDVLAPVFAHQEKALLLQAVQKEETRLIAAESRKADLERETEDLRRKERDLEFSLRENNLSDLRQGLERDEAHSRVLLEAKRRLAEEYSVLAQSLGLPELSTEEIFWKSRDEGVTQKGQLEERLPLLANTWSDGRNRLRELEEAHQNLLEELQFLREREGQIPRALSALRRELSQSLELAEKELPFCGELVRVTQEKWRPALERLLRPWALSLLIPEGHEAEAKAFVKKRNLTRTLRLIFGRTAEAFFVPEDSGMAVDAIEFRKGTGFEALLSTHLRKEWDFRLCESWDELAATERGLTLLGEVKDRQVLERPGEGWDDPSHFLLGWDNQDKLHLLQRKISASQQALNEGAKSLEEVSEKRVGLDARRILLEKLLSFQNWGELSWQTEEAELRDIEKRKAELSGTVDQEALQNRLADLKLLLKEKNREKDEAAGFIGRVKKSLEEYSEEDQDIERVLQNFVGLDLEASRSLLEPWLRQVQINWDLKTLTSVRDQVTKTLAQEKKTATEELSALTRQVEVSMHQYINPGAALAQRFPEWTGETSALMAKTDFLENFLALFERISKEDLPSHQKRFKDWLNQRLVEDIADFKTSLENHQRAIVETVRELNSSLKSITYNTFPATHIQLHTEDSRDVQIRDFRRMLKEALQLDAEDDLEKAFLRIRSIIQSLSENEEWRRRVTDVRNWQQFAAIELFTADGTQRQYYRDSQSLSGGEKAKLAYTILASAIAHQFGIQRGVASRSFRFAVVDEAFSKVDPENSRFAMKLFEQLNLQLMVVTPLDKINVVEDYIQTIHYVENKRRKTSSVYDLTIETYQGTKTSGVSP